MNFTGHINAFRVIERLERMNILGGQNTESVNILLFSKSDINHFSNKFILMKSDWQTICCSQLYFTNINPVVNQSLNQNA